MAPPTGPGRRRVGTRRRQQRGEEEQLHHALHPLVGDGRPQRRFVHGARIGRQSFLEEPLPWGIVLQRRPGLDPGRAEVLGVDASVPVTSMVWVMEMLGQHRGHARRGREPLAGGEELGGRAGRSGGRMPHPLHRSPCVAPPRPAPRHRGDAGCLPGGSPAGRSTLPAETKVKNMEIARTTSSAARAWRSGCAARAWASTSRATRYAVGVSRGSDSLLRVARSDRPSAPLTEAAPEIPDTSM